MNDVFNPSLVISVGPSAKKALDFLNGMLSEIPKHFLNLIECYNIEIIDEIQMELQGIVDNKLLSAKNLNKLVDLGYKVRTENIEGVKIDIYFLWDMYNSEISASELTSIIYGLNYGNVDKSQYSGVSLYLMPIVDKEWLYSEEAKLRGINNLKKIARFITKQEHMININSKIYIFHSISKDGTRISKEELECISSHLIYLNIIPSKQSPLSYINQRLLIHESDFKIGTVGISALTVRKDKLLEEFSGYLAYDIIERVISFEKNMDYSHYDSFRNIKNSSNINELKSLIPHIDVDEIILEFNKDLIEDIWDYPRIMKSFEETFEEKYLGKVKKKIDESSISIVNRAREAIHRELNEIVLKYSLKQGQNFLLNVLKNVKEQSIGLAIHLPKNESNFNEALKKKVENYPSLIGFIVKAAVLLTFLIYSLNNLGVPYLNLGMKIIYIALLTGLVACFTWLDYKYKVRKFENFINAYIEEVYKNSGSIVNQYIERKLAEVQKSIINVINEEMIKVNEGIRNCKKVRSNIIAITEGDEGLEENLVTSLLTFEDRKRFYEAQCQDISNIYQGFVSKLSNFNEFREENIQEIIEKYSKEVANSYISLDFYEFLKFKYGDELSNGISCWVDKAVIKSKELLQYNNTKELERHMMFVATKDFIEASKDVLTRKLCGYEISAIDREHTFVNSISIIKLTLGLELNSITPFMNIEEAQDI